MYVGYMSHMIYLSCMIFFDESLKIARNHLNLFIELFPEYIRWIIQVIKSLEITHKNYLNCFKYNIFCFRIFFKTFL